MPLLHSAQLIKQRETLPYREAIWKNKFPYATLSFRNVLRKVSTNMELILSFGTDLISCKEQVGILKYKMSVTPKKKASFSEAMSMSQFLVCLQANMHFHPPERRPKLPPDIHGSGFQPEVSLSPGIFEDILGGIRKHLT
jgi:hypothetical protein